MANKREREDENIHALLGAQNVAGLGVIFFFFFFFFNSCFLFKSITNQKPSSL